MKRSSAPGMRIADERAASISHNDFTSTGTVRKMRYGLSLLLLFTVFAVQALQIPAGASLDERGVWRIDGAELQLTFAMDNWKWINNAQWSSPKSVAADRDAFSPGPFTRKSVAERFRRS